MARFAVALIATVMFGFVPAAQAADLRAEPVKAPQKERCNWFNNYFIWGDPTDCPNDETVPACDASSVVSAAVRFANRANPAYRIPRVTEFTPLGELHQSVYNPSPLVRRYCEASVQLDNGDHARAYYFVEEDSGFLAIPWAVYVCIDGYDRWRVYDGRCRVAKPAPPK